MEKNQQIKKTEIIAEIANAHQGSSENALKLALESSRAGADAVKFQVYFAEEMLSKNHARYNHFKKQSFNEKTWEYLINSLKKKNIKVYCDVFGVKAFKVAQNNNVDGFKIHSSDLNNLHLLDVIKYTKKKIFLSAGGSTISEIAYAVNILKKNKKKPVLLHGFQSYPTKIENTNIGRISLLKNIFGNNCDYGFQDHLSADDKFNYILPLIAIGNGANYIEKHVTFNRAKKGIDYYSSLEPQELKKFISMINECDKSFLGESYSLFQDEKKYRKEVKKIWFSVKNLKAGNKLKYSDLIMKRPKDTTVNPSSLKNFIGKKLLVNLKSETPICKFYLKNYTTAIIVARSQSKRLPNKATKKICGYETLDHLIRRVKKSKKLDNIILCTTKLKEDNKLIKIAKKNKIKFFKGENLDVLKRMLDSIKNSKTNTIVRITGDDILIDPKYLDLALDLHFKKNFDYTNNKKLPGGAEVEIFDLDFLKKIYYLSEDSKGTEYLTFYVNKYKDQFKLGSLEINKKLDKKINFTIDTQKDFKKVKKFLELMKSKNKLFSYNLEDMVNFYENNKKLFLEKKILKKKIEINTSFNWKKIAI